MNAVYQGYRQLQSEWKHKYVPKITELLARPRTTSSLERRQIDTRKLSNKIQKNIVTVKDMLRTELRRRSSSQRGAAGRRILEMTQHIAHLVDEEVNDYQQLLENALNDTSDDETLVDSEEERELYGQGQHDQLGDRHQGRPGLRDAPARPQRTVRFLPDSATPIVPPARPRSPSRSRARSPPPRSSFPPHSPYSSRNVNHSPALTSQTVPRPDQGITRVSTTFRPDDNRRVSVPEQIPSAAYQRPLPSVDHNIPLQSQQYFHTRHQTPAMTNEFASRSYDLDGRIIDGHHPTNLQGMSAAHANQDRGSFVPGSARSQDIPSHQAQRPTSHRERVYARYGSYAAQETRRPDVSQQSATRLPTRFPSLEALRGPQLETFPRQAPVEPAWAWRAREDYGPESTYLAQHRQAAAPQSQYLDRNDHQQYHHASNQAPPAGHHYIHNRQYQADYDEIQMFAALRLSESDIMNDTTAWQAEADEQGRYVRPGQEHHSTRRGNW
ncbi:hypothetical protein LTR70_000374 [Exophiala xenobiotica]|uniref:Uncharacterized protein n=1 Tax=Lithohypha guttulata TaxID=1690604 RepID=A0ABR0KPM7_9EURO|nr:hypothetical protein LTR24_000075 [Lithohypha guttulata]KAK5330544.1 hypothetical protein LTR70_000374 [Exophiala xenobiotica]